MANLFGKDCSPNIYGDRGNDFTCGTCGSNGDTSDVSTTGNFRLTVSPNVGLTLTKSTLSYNLSTLYNTTIPDTEQSVAIGGVSSQAASVWKSKTIVQVLDTILFPELMPTYLIPTVSLSYSESGVKEVGSSLSQSLTLSGVKNDAGAFTLLTLRRGGTQINSVSSPSGSAATSLPNQYGFADPNNPNFSYSLSFTNTLVVSLGETTWNGSGTFGAGLAKKTSKNTNDTRSAATLSVNAPQSGGSLTSSSVAVTGVYPYFWGKSALPMTASDVAAEIASGTANKIISSASGTISATFNAASEYVWFAHPAADTTKTKWYNTPLNQGSIGSGNFILSPGIESVNSPDGYWSGINYKIYISGYATNTSGSIQLLNS